MHPVSSWLTARGQGHVHHGPRSSRGLEPHLQHKTCQHAPRPDRGPPRAAAWRAAGPGRARGGASAAPRPPPRPRPPSQPPGRRSHSPLDRPTVHGGSLLTCSHRTRRRPLSVRQPSASDLGSRGGLTARGGARSGPAPQPAPPGGRTEEERAGEGGGGARRGQWRPAEQLGSQAVSDGEVEATRLILLEWVSGWVRWIGRDYKADPARVGLRLC